jgi:hypothetical protein
MSGGQQCEVGRRVREKRVIPFEKKYTWESRKYDYNGWGVYGAYFVNSPSRVEADANVSYSAVHKCCRRCERGKPLQYLKGKGQRKKEKMKS